MITSAKINSANSISSINTKNPKNRPQKSCSPIDPYADMLYMPHPDSINHTRMEAEKRAAQFSPFAALTGYEQSIEKTAKEFESSILEQEKGTELFEST